MMEIYWANIRGKKVRRVKGLRRVLNFAKHITHRREARNRVKIYIPTWQ